MIPACLWFQPRCDSSPPVIPARLWIQPPWDSSTLSSSPPVIPARLWFQPACDSSPPVIPPACDSSPPLIPARLRFWPACPSSPPSRFAHLRFQPYCDPSPPVIPFRLRFQPACSSSPPAFLAHMLHAPSTICRTWPPSLCRAPETHATGSNFFTCAWVGEDWCPPHGSDGALTTSGTGGFASGQADCHHFITHRFEIVSVAQLV